MPRKPTGKPAGRPTRAATPARNRLVVRLTDDELAEVKRLAEYAGLSVSAYVRAAVTLTQR